MTLTLNPQTEVRLNEAATRYGLTLSEIVDKAVETLLAEETENKLPPAAESADQTARQAILAYILLKAPTLEPDAPTRKSYRADPAGQGIVEKYRRQGFNL